MTPAAGLYTGVGTVSVAELRQAWRAIQSGQYRAGTCQLPPARSSAHTSWTPGPGERVIPVLGCGGSCGATVLAVGLAESVPGRARLVECCPAGTSGLVAASHAELGVHPSGWVQGMRAGVLLERGHGIGGPPQTVPPPSPAKAADLMDVTVVDVGWRLGELLTGPGWLNELVAGADPVVLVTICTVRGVTRLDSAVAQLSDTAVGVVLGPPRRSWPKAVRHITGPHIRALERSGRLATVPFDRRLAVTGLDSTPLPGPVLGAAAKVLNLAIGHSSKGTPA